MNKNKNISNIISFPKHKTKLERQIEAIIFAADEPLDIETIQQRVGNQKMRVRSSDDVHKTENQTLKLQ